MTDKLLNTILEKLDNAIERLDKILNTNKN